MGESKTNPTAIAKQEGKRSGFAPEVRDLAIIVSLAEIGLQGLKQMDDKDKGESKDRIDTLIALGPDVIARFNEVGKYLFERGKKLREGDKK